MAQKFEKTLTISDFDVVNTDVKASAYNKVLQYTVGAQQMATFGAGSILNGVDDRKINYLVFKDSAGNQLNGWVRYALTDANEVKKIVVFEERSERLGASKTDKTQSHLLGEYVTKAKEDSKLVIEFKPDVDATVDVNQSEALIPITVYTL